MTTIDAGAPPYRPEDYGALVETYFDSGRADGISVLPAPASRIAAMVAATGRKAGDVVGRFPQGKEVTIADIAEVAALAGCTPGYMRVVVPVFEILLDSDFPLSFLIDSSASFFPLVVVNGPVRHDLNINCRSNVFGPGFRANATIGRAIRLGLTHFSGTEERSALGSAYRYTCVLGEDEEHSVFPSLYKAYGYEKGSDTIVVFLAWQPRNVTNQVSSRPEHLLLTYAEELSTVTQFNPLDLHLKGHALDPKALLFIAEEHRGHLGKSGWTLERIQSFLHEATRRRAGSVRACGYYSDSRLHGAADEDNVPLYKRPDDFLIVGTGSGGGRSLIGGAVYGMARPVLPASAANRIEPAGAPSGPPDTLDDYIALVEYYMDNAMTDGWPVVPPDASGIAAMVAASGRTGDEKLGEAPWRANPITVRDAAICAHMAGCTPSSMPLVVAMFNFMFDPAHDQGVAGLAPSTMGYNVWFLIHGPAAREAGLNAGAGLFGPGMRQNVSIGRAIRLGLMNLAGLKPNLVDRSCLGQPYKYGVVIAEDEGAGLWGPVHATLGLEADQSGITMGWGAHPRLTLNDEATTPEELLKSIAEDLSTIQGFDSPSARAPGETALRRETMVWRERILNRQVILTLSRGHQEIFRKAGWSRKQAQMCLARYSARTVGAARHAGYGSSPLIDADQPDDAVINLHRPERLHFICAGGLGGATMVNQFTYLATCVYEDGHIVASEKKMTIDA